MITDRIIKTKLSKCTLHHSNLEIFCKQCNILICIKCLYEPDHKDHFNQTEYLDINSSNSSSSPNQTENNSEEEKSTREKNKFILTRLELLWDLIKVQSSAYSYFSKHEESISSEFRSFHQFLMVEEHKLKKVFTENKDNSSQSVQFLLDEIKKFQSIIDQQNKINRNNNSNNYNGTDNIRSSLINSYNSNVTEDDYDDGIDSHDKYNLFSIIETINKCQSFEQFYKMYKSTLFYNSAELNGYDHLEPEKLKQQQQFNMLKTIQAHMHQLDNNKVTMLKEPVQYSVSVDKTRAGQLMSKFKDTFRVVDKDISQDPQNKMEFIFSLSEDGSCSIFNLTNLTFENVNQIQKIGKYTCGSVVTVNESIYIFDGSTAPFKYYKYDMVKGVCTQAIVTGIESAYSVQTCYDGNEYIYICGGQGRTTLNRVDRLNINTGVFEMLGDTKGKHQHGLAFYHKGLVYIAALKNNKDHHFSIVTFDPVTKEYKDLVPTVGFHITADCICFDGTDRVYFIDYYNVFYSFSLSTLIKKELSPPPNVKTYSMIYVEGTTNSSNCIYLMCGKSNSNHIYNVRNNEWSILEINDTCASRMYSGACYLSLGNDQKQQYQEKKDQPLVIQLLENVNPPAAIIPNNEVVDNNYDEDEELNFGLFD